MIKVSNSSRNLARESPNKAVAAGSPDLLVNLRTSRRPKPSLLQVKRRYQDSSTSKLSRETKSQEAATSRILDGARLRQAVHNKASITTALSLKVRPNKFYLVTEVEEAAKEAAEVAIQAERVAEAEISRNRDKSKNSISLATKDPCLNPMVSLLTSIPKPRNSV